MEIGLTRQIYEYYGISEYFGYINTKGPHDYTEEAREYMYAWFNKWLLGIEDPAKAKDPENLTLKDPEVLTVGFPPEHRDLLDLNFEFAGKVYQTPQLPVNNTEWLAFKNSSISNITEILDGSQKLSL